MKIKLLILLSTIFTMLNISALSPDATQGKTFYQSCHACHNTALDPAKGPPMWGVQRRYKRAFGDIDTFRKKMINFVKAPTLEIAIHDEALKSLGLMPAMPLPDNILKNITTYIWEEDFPPPCDHWQMAVKKATASGDLDHAKKDQQQLNKFCS